MIFTWHDFILIETLKQISIIRKETNKKKRKKNSLSDETSWDDWSPSWRHAWFLGLWSFSLIACTQIGICLLGTSLSFLLFNFRLWYRQVSVVPFLLYLWNLIPLSSSSWDIFLPLWTTPPPPNQAWFCVILNFLCEMTSTTTTTITILNGSFVCLQSWIHYSFSPNYSYFAIWKKKSWHLLVISLSFFFLYGLCGSKSFSF